MIAARGFWRPTALLLFSLSATVPTFAGDFTITGTVRAMSGAPVVGATVAVDCRPVGTPCAPAILDLWRRARPSR